jgi:hypothetical protein
VLVFGGVAEHAKGSSNAIDIFKWGVKGEAEHFTSIQESFAGIPPPMSLYRSTVWLASEQKLLTFCGRHDEFELSDAVLKMSDDAHDIKQFYSSYNTELYSFDLPSKQWTRLRTPEYGAGRSGHTLVDLDGKLVLLGGARFALGARGRRDKRDYYVSDVLRFDLELLREPQKPGQQHSATTGSRKGKGKRKGKRK